MVPARHAVDLADADMAFVHEQQRVVRQIFKQGRRRFPRHTSGEEAGIILNARAASGRRDHFEVEIGALFQPLGFEQFAFRDQLLQPFLKLKLNRFHRLFQRRAGRHIVAVGIDADIIEAGDLLAGQRIELDDLLNIIPKETDAPGGVLIVRGEDFEIVALHAEIAARKARVVALILERDELADDLALVDRLALLEIKDHRRIGLNRSDTVKAGNRRDDQHIIAFQKRSGG